MNYRLVILVALCSNNILIVNAETIVAVSFIAFIMFSFSTISAILASSLAERSQTITNEILTELTDVKAFSIQVIQSRLLSLIKVKWFIYVSQIQHLRLISLYRDVVFLPQYNNTIESHNYAFQALLNLKNFVRARSFLSMSLFFHKVIDQKIS